MRRQCVLCLKEDHFFSGKMGKLLNINLIEFKKEFNTNFSNKFFCYDCCHEIESMNKERLSQLIFSSQLGLI